jgi:hypothetical protein
MKKTILALAVAAIGVSAFGQGHVNYSNNSTTRVSTNDTVNYKGTALVGGSTGLTYGSGTAPSGFYYALLAQSYAGGATVNATLANVLTGGWTYTGVTAINGLAGGSISGGADTTTTAGMPLGAQNQFVVVGWSANLGITTWAGYSAALAANNFTAGGFTGISAVGTGLGNASPPEAIFSGTGIITPFTMFSTTVTPVPEPTTLALAGLGGAALLLFRRRK